MKLGGLYEDIRAEVDLLEIISTHEHNLVPERGVPVTLEYIFQHSYVGWCGVSPGETGEEREAFLHKVGVNSYYRWLLFALRDLYGFEGELTAQNWDEVSSRITRAHEDPEWYFKIMAEHGRIRRAILDAYWDPGSDNGHPEYYSPAFRINAFVMSYGPKARDHNGNNAFDILSRYGMEVKDFDDYLGALEALLNLKKLQGCVALKSALAYDRPLYFDEVPHEVAEGVFAKRGCSVSPAEAKAFGDYMFYFIAERAGELGLPLQCHVGLGRIGGSNPMNLVPVIEKCPKTRFVLFHGGYPWFHQIGGLLHNYDNVYADLVWLPLISPTAAVSALHEWIEVAKTSEKLTWGGDAWTPEEVYGGTLSIRYVISKVLAEKLAEGYFDRETALKLARLILSENARKLYRLQ
ncbi:MAG: amidohydrolase family protein [Firmicutes bacterium]|nr:amidohydrolase family protein [Bacillota bacterium]